MSNNINTFCPLKGYVPTLNKDGQDWFMLKEVYRALGLSADVVNHKHFLAQADWSQIVPNYARSEEDTVHLVTESGFYRLVFISEEPQAQAFQSWVLNTVLPAVTNDGMYVIGEEKSFPAPEGAFINIARLKRPSSRSKVYWEHVISELLPALRRDCAYFRDIHEIADAGETSEALKAEVEAMVQLKSSRREYIRSITN